MNNHSELVRENEMVEKLSEQIHKVYCDYYQQRHGKPYWTNGDYGLLEDATKEADRFMARFILRRDKKNGAVLADVMSKSIDDNATYDAIEITLKNLGYNRED